MTVRWKTVLLFSLSLVGCGGGNGVDAGSDLTAAVGPDMTSAPDAAASADLAMAAMDGGGGDGAVSGYTACGNVYVGGPQRPTITEECVACATNKCCAEGTACGMNADCSSIRNCFKTCGAGHPDCDTACYAQFPKGQKDSDALSGCRGSKCALECENLFCVGKVVWVDPPVKSYTFKLSVVELQSGAMIAGASVKVCGKADATCANPLSMSTTAMDGTTMVTVPSAKDGVDGYVELTAMDMVPSLLYFQYVDPVAALNGGSIRSTVLSNKTLAQFAGLLNVTLDPQRAGVLFIATDCADLHAAGFSAAVDNADNKSLVTYVEGAFPSASAKATDGSGLGGVINLPVGSATVTGKTNTGVQVSSQKVLLRAGYFTSVNLAPSP